MTKGSVILVFLMLGAVFSSFGAYYISDINNSNEGEIVIVERS